MSSRRDFIRLVLLGTGATYAVGLGGCKRPSELKLLRAPERTHATPQFKTAHSYLRDRAPLPMPTSQRNCEVLVIGAGVSGLTAAAMLENEGRDVVLVESESRPGGAAVSEVLGGGPAPLGSVYFIERTAELEVLLNLTGIEPVLCPDDGYDFGTDELVVDLWNDEVLDHSVRSDSDRDGMKRFRDHVLGLGENLPLYPLPEVLSPEMAALDVSAEEWVKSFKSHTLTTVLNSYARSSMGALLSRTNIYCLLNFYSGEFGPSFDLPRYTFPGGTGTLTKQAGAKLDSATMDQVAVRVSNNGLRSEVDCVNAKGEVVRYVADRVIMAAPKYQAPYLIPEMPSSQVAACKQLSHAPYITLHIVSDLPLVEDQIYDTWNLTSEFETDVVNPRSVPGARFSKNVCSLFLPMDQFARGVLQDPQLFARHTADVADRFISSRTPEQQASVREIYAWGWGHGLVVPTPGSHNGVAQAARQPIGNVIFANADCDAAPAIENAAYHGARAVDDVLKSLRS